MNTSDLKAIKATMEDLKQMQETPDPPEALANIPTLKIADLAKQNKTIPLTVSEQKGTQIFYHDLASIFMPFRRSISPMFDFSVEPFWRWGRKRRIM